MKELLRGVDGVLDHLPEVDPRHLPFRPARLQLREIEHLIDETGQALALLDDEAEELLPFGRLEVRIVVQDLGHRPDRRQRGAQLVDDRRDEIVLHPVELLQPLVGRLELGRRCNELLRFLLQLMTVRDDLRSLVEHGPDLVERELVLVHGRRHHDPRRGSPDRARELGFGEAHHPGMGLVGAAMGVGMVLGPGIGGMMGGASLHAPFYLAAALSFLATILIWAFLPESLAPDKRTTAVKGFRGPQFNLMWAALFGSIGFLYVLAFMHSFALANFEGIFAYYAEAAFGYNSQTIGIILTVVGLTSAVVQGVFTGMATKKWGDVTVVKASLFASVFGFLRMLTAYNLATVILMTSLFILSNSMLRPAVSSLRGSLSR